MSTTIPTSTEAVSPPTAARLGGETITSPGSPHPAAERQLGVGLVIGGVLGLISASVLIVERIRLLTNPSVALSCDLNPVVSCGSVLTSPQAQAFGFPNPLLGLVGFTVILVTGTVLIAGLRLPAWYWAGLQVGATFGIAFVAWLVWNSLYRIGALCPYCMVVWLAVIPIFIAVTLRNLRAVDDRLPNRAAQLVGRLSARQPVLVVVAYLVIVSLIAVEFWVFWRSLLG